MENTSPRNLFFSLKSPMLIMTSCLTDTVGGNQTIPNLLEADVDYKTGTVTVSSRWGRIPSEKTLLHLLSCTSALDLICSTRTSKSISSEPPSTDTAV